MFENNDATTMQFAAILTSVWLAVELDGLWGITPRWYWLPSRKRAWLLQYRSRVSVARVRAAVAGGAL